jgi:hypothetical protein
MGSLPPPENADGPTGAYPPTGAGAGAGAGATGYAPAGASGGGAATPPSEFPHMLQDTSVSWSIHPQLGQGFIRASRTISGDCATTQARRARQAGKLAPRP